MKTLLTASLILCSILTSLAQEQPQLLTKDSYPLLRQRNLRTLKIYTSLDTALAERDTVYRLDLSKQGLKEIPKEVLQLRKLQELYLSQNEITELPDSFYVLQNLQKLDLNQNKLTVLPGFIGKMQYLQILQIMSNQLQALPDSIGELFRMQVLQLQENNLSTCRSSRYRNQSSLFAPHSNCSCKFHPLSAFLTVQNLL